MTDITVDVESISLAERAYRAVRDQLVMLEIPPGAPINDERLAATLGVGRTPVREALKRLEADRLVIAYPRRGTFATEVNITQLGHITEVRLLLEPAAAAAAAERRTAGDLVGLRLLLERLAPHAGVRRGSRDLMRLDMDVHRAIYAATHNPFLEDTLVRHDLLATRIWCLFLDRLPDLAGHVGEHGPLLTAIVDGDPTAAAGLATAHVVHFAEAIRAAL